MRRFSSLFFWIGLSACLALTGCPKKGGGGGNDPCEGFSGVCLDLTAYVSDQGTGAVVREATAADLIGGPTAIGQVGDWYLANEGWWRPIREQRYAGERIGTTETAVQAT